MSSWLGQSERGEEFTYNTQGEGSYLFPGHKYLWPGNTLNKGTPVDEDDAIAEAHDHDYNRAKNLKDIQTADHKAIHDFLNSIVNKGDIHSVGGVLGLGVKSIFETAFGVQYPKISGKIWHLLLIVLWNLIHNIAHAYWFLLNSTMRCSFQNQIS